MERGFERLEGSLLRYEEWQTALHLERLRAGPHAKKLYWLQRPLKGGPPKNIGRNFRTDFVRSFWVSCKSLIIWRSLPDSNRCYSLERAVS